MYAMNRQILQGDAIHKLKEIKENSMDLIVTDPPYFLLNSSGKGFMGKEWDSINIKNTYNMVCGSKELANFAVKFFGLMKVESNTEEEYIAPENVNIQDKKITENNTNVQSVASNSKDTHKNQNTHSAQMLVVTGVDLWDLLKELLGNRTTFHPEQNPFQSALYVIPHSILVKKLKGIALENVLKLPTKLQCQEQKVSFTLMEEVRINAVIEAMIGSTSENEFMKETAGAAKSVENTARKKRYKLITLSPGEKQETTQWLTLLLYAIHVTQKLNKIPTNTDLQYQVMGEFNKSWMRESLRVLKPGAFAYIMCSPRQDVQSVMMQCCKDAGFVTTFTSISHAYASGFPKAANISKLVDKKGALGLNKEFCELIKKKRKEDNLSTIQLAELGHFYGKVNHGGTVSNWEEGLGVPTLAQYNKLIKILNLKDYPEVQEAQREITGKIKNRTVNSTSFNVTASSSTYNEYKKPETTLAKKLDGSYAGFQPKPAVEVILVCMKPLSEKNYVEQAMKNGKGVTWFDDVRIPSTDKEGGSGHINFAQQHAERNNEHKDRSLDRKSQMMEGRFPANLLVSDDVLNDGKITKGVSGGGPKEYGGGGGWDNKINRQVIKQFFNDSGSFSRYFDVDAWLAQYLIVEKASKSEKNAGLENLPAQYVNQKGSKNNHPTVKPITLMSYLITMGSREGDTILDPFAGSGTTLIAASLLKRDYIGIEIDSHYCNIAKSRLEYWKDKKFEKLEKIKKQAEKKKVVKLEEFT